LIVRKTYTELAAIERLRAAPEPRKIAPEPPPQESFDHSRLRRNTLNQDPSLRFTVLKEWISINALAILHRASGEWKTANDLTANIPDYLEPEAEVLNRSILLIGTRQHAERLAIPLQDIDSFTDFRQSLGPDFSQENIPPIAAVLRRANGHFKLVSTPTAAP
jgi:hypothetical protein